MRNLVLSGLAVRTSDVCLFEHGFLNRLWLRGRLVVVQERLHLAIVWSLFHLLFLLCLFAKCMRDHLLSRVT